MGLEGPLKGKSYPLKPGLTLGRQAEISIPDAKASQLHAQVQADAKGELILIDNNSKNGTRVGGERVETLALVPGTTFFIGDQGFEVVEIIEQAPEPVKRYWYDVLALFLGQNVGHFGDKMRPVAPLEPALVLEFARGMQTNARWILGYGPRRIGAASLDLPIWEPGAPPVCFEISPCPDGILFKTSYPQMVKLNGESVDSRVLRVGDTIRIHETLIEVDFSE